jgi:hypothetical protein
MASRALKLDPGKNQAIISEPPHESTVPEGSDEYGIAALAYLFWQERGCPIGSDQEDWFRAEETLKSR